MIISKFIYNQNYSNATIIVNALFLIMLLLFGFADPMAIVFAYVFETVIIGLLHIIKLFYVASHNKPNQNDSKWLNFIVTPFFLVHYGFFVVIQTIFIYTAFAINDDRFSTSLSFSNYLEIFKLNGFYIVAAFIIFSHLYTFFMSFLKLEKYKNKDFNMYFIKPYIRIFIQQFLAIVPMFFLIYTNRVGTIAAIFLIIMRTSLDTYFNYIAQNQSVVKKLALKIVDKNNLQELPSIEANIKMFFED